MLLLSVLGPSLEYGSEVWEGNKSQAASVESIMLAPTESSECCWLVSWLQLNPVNAAGWSAGSN